jgi:hypothetical protein
LSSSHRIPTASQKYPSESMIYARYSGMLCIPVRSGGSISNSQSPMAAEDGAVICNFRSGYVRLSTYKSGSAGRNQSNNSNFAA